MAEQNTILGGKVYVYKRPDSSRWHHGKNRGLSSSQTHSTMNHEIVTLRQTLKTATRHGWLDRLPDFSEPYRISSKISYRAWFSPEEYEKLCEATRKRALEPKKRRFKWQAEQLHDYVLFAGNTGLRPDEARRLEFRDVNVVDDEPSGETILEIEVRGKRGQRWRWIIEGLPVIQARPVKR